MTDQEKIDALMSLANGSVVEVLNRGAWIRGRVVSTMKYATGRLMIGVQPISRTPGGKKRWRRDFILNRAYDLNCVRLLSEVPDPARMDAQVCADWLEERGFDAAAAALRGAFPLSVKEEA